MTGDMSPPSEPARPAVRSVEGAAAVGGDVNMQGGVVAGRDIRIDQLQQTTVLPRPVPGPAARLQLPPDVWEFTGRTAELAKLQEILEQARTQNPTATPVLLVNGMPGVGKSALALYLAHLLREDYPDARLYVRLSGVGEPTVTAADALDRLLRALGVEPGQPPTTLEERVGLYRTMLAEQRALVLLDNALDRDQVEPLRPATGGSQVLVTSRSDLPGMDGVTGYRLQPMLTNEGAELLGRLVGAERVAADQGAAERVVGLCGGLPLAIRLAGASMATTATRNLPLGRLVDRLADTRHRLDALDDEADERRAVRASFQLSYQQLPEEQASVFRWLSLLQVPDVAAKLVAALVDAELEDAQRWIQELVNRQLVEPVGPTGERYRLHDLLALYAVELAQQDPVEDRHAAIRRGLAWYLGQAERMNNVLSVTRADLEQLAQGDSELAEQARADAADIQASFVHEALRWFDAERASLVAIQAQAAELGEHESVCRIAIRLFDFLNQRKHWRDLQTTDELALRAARRVGDRYSEGAAVNALGVVYRVQRRFGEAIDSLQRGLEISRELGNRSAEAKTLNNLGNLYVDQRQYAEAVSTMQQSLGIFRELGDRYSEGANLSNLGIAYRWQRRFVEAIDSYQQSMLLCQELGDRYGEGVALANLGIVYREQRRFGEAIDSLQQSLTIFRELGARHNEGQALRNLGAVYALQGARRRAEHCYMQALTILQELQAPEAGDVAVSLVELRRRRGLRSLLAGWRGR